MKRLVVASLSLLTTVFVACGGQPSDDPETAPSEPTLAPIPVPVPAAPTLSSTLISFENTTINAGTNSSLSLSGIYSDGNISRITDDIVWASSDESIAAVDANGLLQANSAGAVTITSSVLGVDSSQLFTISSATLTSIALSTITIQGSVGLESQLILTGLYDNGNSYDLSNQATWTSSATNFATVSDTGLVTGVSAGAATITASYSSMTAQASVSISGKTLSSISVSPSYISAPIGTAQQMIAIGIFDDNSFTDISSSVTWTSSDSSAASISSLGLVERLSSGSSVISAEINGVSGSTLVLVTGVTLNSLSLSRTSFSLPAGTSEQMILTGTYSDGSSLDLTEQALWTSSTTSVASINNSIGSKGVLSASSEGNTNITASFGGQSTTTDLTVTNVNLVSISIDPAGILLSKTVNHQFTATGTYSDSSEVDLTEMLTWSSTNSSWASISNTNGNRGYLTNYYSGSTTESVTISASLDGITQSVDVILTPNTITSIVLTPANVIMNSSSTQKLSAIASFDDGASSDVSNYVTWSTSDSSLAVIGNGSTSGGQFTAISEGTVTVTAILGSITTNSSITIDNAQSPTSTDIGVGLTGHYHTGTNFNTFRGTRVDSEILFSLGTGQAPLGVGDSYSVRWTGRFVPEYTEEYTLSTISDDGVRLFVDDVEIISNWTLHAATENSTSINLEAGKSYNIRLEFFENGGHSRIELYWQSSSQAKQIIPKERLFHE